MAQNQNRKIQHSVGFTQRQSRLLEAEAARLDIPIGDLVRRLIDEWADRMKVSQPTRDPRAAGMYARQGG